MLRADQIINPLTHHVMNKYEDTWWHYIVTAKKHRMTKTEMEILFEDQPLVFTQQPIVTLVKNVDFRKTQLTRAGFILYAFENDQLYIGLGVDKTFQELTDFSGGISKHEAPLLAALRELCEETIGLFCDITTDDIANDVAIYDKHHLVIFHRIDAIDDTMAQFDQLKKQSKQKIEVDDIEWMTPKEIMSLMSTHKSDFYVRLYHFLNKAGDFYDQLI